MKIGRFVVDGTVDATGVLVDINGEQCVLNLSRAAAVLAPTHVDAGSLTSLIGGGKSMLDQAYDIIERSCKHGEATWFTPLSHTRWLVPTVPNTFLCAGRNFGRHRDEADTLWASRGGNKGQSEIPTGFVKLRSSLVAHGCSVARPPGLITLDYEVEVVAILGQRVQNVSEASALDAVFGYTVFNDLSAREWQFREMENRLVIIGKNFPGAGPFGPWILTADEVPDPQVLGLELKVNGKRRQHIADCTDMIFTFAQLIAFWSMMGLDPGDAIASGTPEGVAHSHKPDPQEWFLKPGDVVEAEVRQIGVLETRIV